LHNIAGKRIMGVSVLRAALMLLTVAVHILDAAASLGSGQPSYQGSRAGGLLLRLRGGDDDDEAQMAEIRARRAKQYEEQKSAHNVEAADIAAEEKGYVGAQKVWAIATDKLSARTIQPKVPMSKGDARSFYIDGAVTLLRNHNTGMVIELLHDSAGWFQFMAREGAALQQMSATGNVVPVERFYAAGLLDDIKGNPLKTSLIRSKGMQMGPWSIGIKGAALVLKHSNDPTREVHLLEEGFVYTSTASDEGIHVDSTGAPSYMPKAEADTIIASLSS